MSDKPHCEYCGEEVGHRRVREYARGRVTTVSHKDCLEVGSGKNE